ncbi:hypothetical protein K7432_018118 [Basidiobolus ranarum]|uniref:Uncharacterized protein n=1 Tax=Basidiobolus ranarum TaxID=34480 RepID=A0ABR2WCJ9_9FUNG
MALSAVDLALAGLAPVTTRPSTCEKSANGVGGATYLAPTSAAPSSKNLEDDTSTGEQPESVESQPEPVW